MPNDGVSWRVEGLKPLEQQLQSLPEKVEKKVLRGAVSAGAKVIQADARKRVRSHKGDLVDAIRFTTSVKPGLGLATSKVFVSAKKAWYGRLVEGGTKPHLIKSKTGKALKLHGGRYVMQIHHPGSKPYPFMRPAAESQSQNAVTAITNRIKAFFDSYRG